MNANYKSIILAIGLFFALSASISAAPGDLDSTFGNGGIVITNFSGFDSAYAMAIQADGKIVVTGQSSSSQTGFDISVFRYNPNGTLDTSFGGTGIVITPLASGKTLPVR